MIALLRRLFGDPERDVDRQFAGLREMIDRRDERLAEERDLNKQLEKELAQEVRFSAGLAVRLGEPDARKEYEHRRWVAAMRTVHEDTFEQAEKWIEVDAAGMTDEGQLFVQRRDDAVYGAYRPGVPMTEQLLDLADELKAPLPDFLADDEAPGRAGRLTATVHSSHSEAQQ